VRDRSQSIRLGAREGIRHVVPLGALLLVSLPVLPCQQGIEPAPATISVDVNLVVLNVTAKDPKGAFVQGLQAADFHVFEDGRPQEIRLFRHEDIPVSVGLIVDNSLSMRRKRAGVTAAALAFVRSSNPQDQMFVVNFNDRVSFGLPGTELFSASAPQLELALNGVPADGRTALYDAIQAGLHHLTKAGRDKKVLIVVSDGGDNASRSKLREVLTAIGRSNAIVYTIGLFDETDGDQNPGVLRKIARASGGEAYLPENEAAVVPICQRIAQDIRSQYTIGYLSSNPALDGSYRRIRVTAARAQGHDVRIRTRTGYVAASATLVR